MSYRAWGYIGGVLVVGLLSSWLAMVHVPSEISYSHWMAFATLTLLTTIAQLLKARGPKHEAWHANLVFLLAGVLLLPTYLYVFLVVIPHLIEWAKERLTASSSLRHWYIQPFNIATHLIAGLIAHRVFVSLAQDTLLATFSMLAALAASVVYVLINHTLVGQALVLARGISWRESGVMAVDNLFTDLVLLFMGYLAALTWQLNPWLILAALSPLAVTYRALMVPQLKQEAQTDQKTGLLNARYFAKMFEAEMERAQRFSHPLAIIMADLDLLRNINNSYGHLAGDVVLIGIAHIIRESVRKEDLAGRFGGEEFAIVLPEMDLAEAQVFAEDLRQTIAAAQFNIDTSPSPIQVTMSLGVACFPADATTPKDLIHQADIAVYQAKLQGRNRVVLASELPPEVIQQGIPGADRLAAPYVVPFTPRPEIGQMAPQSEEPPATDDSAADSTEIASSQRDLSVTCRVASEA